MENLLSAYIWQKIDSSECTLPIMFLQEVDLLIFVTTQINNLQ